MRQMVAMGNGKGKKIGDDDVVDENQTCFFIWFVWVGLEGCVSELGKLLSKNCTFRRSVRQTDIFDLLDTTRTTHHLT